MANSVYKVITVIGSSTESFEKAAEAAVAAASKTLKGVHVAEVQEFFMHVEAGKITSYRAKVQVAFEYNKKFKK